VSPVSLQSCDLLPADARLVSLIFSFSRSTYSHMMTVSAFGSSTTHDCPGSVLAPGSRRVVVHDVNSRYLIFQCLILFLELLFVFMNLLHELKLTDCLTDTILSLHHGD
jgi:hypothetical protein